MGEKKNIVQLSAEYPHHMVPTPMTTKVPFKPTFILTYNPHNPPLKEWFNEGYVLLKCDPKLKLIYLRPPSVTFLASPQPEKNPNEKSV